MSKRKQQSEDKAITNSSGNAHVEEDSGDSDEDFETLDVDFEWFDPSPEIDFHGIKSLLNQLFDIDAVNLNISALTDLILSQPTLGSTVKVDGQETDAYAFLSVINLHTHTTADGSKPFVAELASYLRSRSASNTQLSTLTTLLSQTPLPKIGLILTDRLINCPAEVAPPMYAFLPEEIAWAVQEGEPYEFTHYLIVSKTYTEIASQLDNGEDERPKKKKKQKGGSGGSGGGAFETMYFHPEDEVFERYALCAGGYEYATQRDEGTSDSKRAFQEMGIRPMGRLILIEAGKFTEAVAAVGEFLKPLGA
ncbi:Protein bcp1 [Cyphellophora attinorum]|uniref:Protein BCP1 n=1 Tax=Cyphellophora attinorum TaxID=1664694 RepID=A0A0N0NKJ5_9EURO|nr:Protein bcp1 [Phialophora attinorum]KPI38098.1 Protein bcp1 [Phialophora attinorum]